MRFFNHNILRESNGIIPLLITQLILFLIACDETITKPAEKDMMPYYNGNQIDLAIDQKVNEGGNENIRLKEFGEYCNENKDCVSGYCVPDGRDSVCSQLCLADCPSGWNCKGISNTGSDTTFVCFKDDARICRRCIKNEDCPKGACYELDGQLVCGTDCETDTDCISGYECADIITENDESKQQCVPKNKSCSCDQETDGDLRICERKNELGTCIGRQTCALTEGWSDCDAQEPIAELCNQIDDNCDGLTDNIDGLGDICTRETQIEGNTLICKGRLICTPTSPEPFCTAQAPTAEKCNFLDDDCDGITDEGFESRDQVCTVGTGLCQRFGVYTCSEDGSQVACNVLAGTPAEDLCDGLDNDCDGSSDEQFPGAGTLCEVGQGICRKFGTLRCSEDKASLVCSEEPGVASEELCDGLDNDCDGMSDEIFPELGQICTAGEGLCRQSSLVRCSDDKTATFCEVEAALGQMERCDGLDNDCDGKNDEEYLLLGMPCSVGQGGCERRGLFICDGSSEGVICSVSEGMASVEICDGIDNDCDLNVDEGFLALGEACSVGVGLCQSVGINRCALDGSEVQCSAQPKAATVEKCDSQDNDCDGVVDNGFEGTGEICEVGIGLCRQIGVKECAQDGSAVICNAMPNQPMAERCDTLDNDCDGRSDEDFPEIGQICTAGVGACRQSSVTLCKLDGSDTECLVNASSATEEKCDSLDNDCDGNTDETFAELSNVCVRGIGACERKGLMICDETAMGIKCSVEAGLPSANELCDGIDNDCDGHTDEGYAQVGEVCQIGIGACQQFGVYKCSQDGQNVACTVQGGNAFSERCDGIDNDCDGRSDEDFPTVGTVCNEGVGLCQKAGVIGCSADGSLAVCSATAGMPINELCDSLDNDCDGRTDETFANIGQICNDGIGLCRKTGTIQCTADKTQAICSAMPGLAAVEKCDGLDNDCDGRTDETFGNVGQICSVGVGLCRQTGVLQCSVDGLSASCSVNAGMSEAEKCDGADNDCDGKNDETFANLGQVCQAGVGQCSQTGTIQCTVDGLSASCTAIAGSSAVEKCDGADNDCDGKTDETFANIGQVCSAGIGLCKNTGTIQCDVNGLSASCNAIAGGAVLEKCDGADNDCDGKTDETFADIGQVCNAGVGLCKNTGTIQCSADGLSASCSAIAGIAVVEKCDGADNDCDGKTDETFANIGQICSAGVGLCKNTGTIQCSVDGLSASCNAIADLPEAEKCDGADNDCDSKTDETFANIGQVCNVGVGLCRNTGTIQCSADGLSASCSAVAGLAVAEKCDGADNDCDGKIDETFANIGQVCNAGIGLCKNTGTIQCSVDGLSASCNAIADLPEAEKCDGADNDCDSKTDETFANIGQVCNAGVGLCRNTGTIQCSVDGLSASCSATAGLAVAEKCDGADNDCDGKTDETFANIGQVCNAGVGLCKNTGTIQCTADGLSASCSAIAGTASAELCDSADNDCDSRTDETFANLNDVCSVGVGECLRRGRFVCSNDNQSSLCSAVAGTASAELCDDLDNNCNGSTDELWPTKNQACSVGLGLCLRTGIFTCNSSNRSGPVVCSASVVAGNASEACDYQDDDCDGKTDETFTDAQGLYSLSINNCGACNSKCNDLWNNNPSAFGVTPTCSQIGGIAQCSYQCLPNYYDADGLSSNGCELTEDLTSVYVSTTQNGGVSDATCGPLSKPCATITQGLSRAVALGKTKVRVGEGVYREVITLVAGIELLGGHQRNTWIRNPNVTVSHIDTRGLASADAHRYGVIASSINTTTKLDGFLITSGTPALSGNSYGIYIKDSNQLLTISNNRVTAGDGGRGADGTAGISGPPGLIGSQGLTSYQVRNVTCGNPSTAGNAGRLGGAGGQRTCNGTNVHGGTGSWSSCGAYNTTNGTATAGLTALGGAAGISAKNWTSANNSTCTVPGSNTEGSAGSNGTNGTDGIGGTTNNNVNGSIASFHWLGNSGGNGATGINGGGGGGGGAAASVVIQWTSGAYDIGASGGGGGSGGCAGNAGTGGSAGGGSFGIFITYTAAPSALNQLPILQSNVITRGFGGKGGSGGNGGGGGEGGNGGVGGVAGSPLYMGFCSLQAGNGGAGGRGGHGGAGAGGNGGISYDIYVSNVGALLPTYDASNSFTLLANDATAGTAGSGGNSSNTVSGVGAIGANGVSGRMFIKP